MTRPTALVTGAAVGIGAAIARRLAADGFAIAVADIDPAGAAAHVAALREAGHAAHAFTVDVSDAASVDALVAAVHEWGGTVDALVNNAGITGPHGSFATYDRTTWRRVIEIDLVGTMLCTQAVMPIMVAQGSGRIVNIASIAGKEGNPNAAAYSAAKAGVIALTKSIAKELADLDIAVNCITPAAARTRIFEQISQAHIDYMLSRIPRGRFVKVEEVAAMVAWLVSEENSFTTGAAFDLSGGRASY